MARAPQVYTRLTRNAIELGAYSSLWVGQGDLIFVRSTGYSERYSRLRLRDIKGFFTMAGDRRLGWGLFWGVVLFFSGIVAIVGWQRDQTPIASGVVAGVALVILIWNQLLGPACRMYVVTDVQVLPLPALVRRPRARRVLARLQPMILEAQADLVPAAPASVPEAAAPAAAAPALPSQFPPSVSPNA